jgi:glycine/D-amino acid oxidase-like deaminating enzyme
MRLRVASGVQRSCLSSAAKLLALGFCFTARSNYAACACLSHQDWVPIYDKSALPGFCMAVGTSGNQFKNAGPVGNMMATLIQQVYWGDIFAISRVLEVGIHQC